MNGTTEHFFLGGIDSFLVSYWPYLAGGGVVVLLLLLVLTLKFSRKKKPPRNKVTTSKTPDELVSSIIKKIRKSNGQSEPVLLAGSCLDDLPATIPIKLAIALAEQGTCLLIDLDSKRDAMAKVFDIDSSQIGIHLKMSPVQTSFENLSIWPARYFDLMKQMNLRELLDTANKKFDHTILYAPYLMVLADRKQIASLSRQAIIFGKQRQRNGLSSLQQLLDAQDCKILCEM